MNEQIIEKVINNSIRIEEFLNKTALPHFSMLHGINPKFSKFDLKQEVVADTSLFFNVKKKYSLHLVSKDRKSVDELFNRGISLRRSDFPSYTKEKLKNILDLLLKSEKLNIKEIWSYINDTTEEIRNMISNGDKRIAKPVACRRDDAYKNGKLPSHMLGMKLWNNLEYDYFVDGTKGYKFNIIGVDPWDSPERVSNKINTITDKNNNIVVPFEEPRLPEYYVIDIDSMLKFAWIDRYNELLSPVMDVFNRFRR